MKSITKINRIWVLFLVCLLCMGILFTGCGRKEKRAAQFKEKVYYIDKKQTTIVPKEYVIKAQTDDKRVEELLTQLKKNTDDVEVTKAIPDGVSVEGYYLEDGVLSISFNADYGKMKKAQEVLTRAAVVLTVSQLDCVEYVSFNVGGQPLAKANGEAVGNMKAADFASNLDKNKEVYNTDNFTVYFANEQGKKLVKYEFEAQYGSNMSKEQFIINKLIEGPEEEEGYVRTLSNNIKVVSVVTMDNVCYVTFAENFLTEPSSVSDELVIYSIVDSLSEIPYIHKVQIRVNGQQDASYHGNISLVEPFSRNLDYVEKEETN